MEYEIFFFENKANSRGGTKVILTLRGTGVDDNGQRLNPTPTYPYDTGGSYGRCTSDTVPMTADCSVSSKVMIYKYDAFADFPQDQDYNTAFPCNVQRWDHNIIECDRLFIEGSVRQKKKLLFFFFFFFLPPPPRSQHQDHPTPPPRA